MKISKLLVIFLLSSFFSMELLAQIDRWQQEVDYTMDIDFDVKSNQFIGTQKLVYKNNSPDTLHKVYYHLYFNAFQPYSMMDIRSRTIKNPNPKVAARIYGLSDEEIGFHKIHSLKQDGSDAKFEEAGTILEVKLNKPIYPGQKSTFDMAFKSQVPLQVRRSGRDNAEGIEYSMSQWYPKMCEYDYQGWHANPYIGAEFYGVWGDFDVTIHIDADYVLAGSGLLKNSEKIGHGYQKNKSKNVKHKTDKISWHFDADNVHDFVWAADPDYVVKENNSVDGVKIFYVFQPGEKTDKNWSKLPDLIAKAFPFINKRYGKYPYPVYTFIQGGDGGMEYPMATLITGERSFPSLASVAIHELMHSWYQMVLGTNESLYSWMDEGFTSFASTEVKNFLRKDGILADAEYLKNPFESVLDSYVNYALSGIEEPLTTHADHFASSSAYGSSAYTKGQVLLKQLEYIMGKRAFQKGLLRYFDDWKFKHPNANDFFRIMERESGLELDWYKEYFVHSTHMIDYSMYSVEQDENFEKATVFLVKNGRMPFPIDVKIVYEDNTSEIINIPLRMMRGAKSKEESIEYYSVAEDWPWTNPYYVLSIDTRGHQIISAEIDPNHEMADINRADNSWRLSRN